jgi:hypothetical protein
MTCKTEEFIRQASARNWSKTMTYEALGITYTSFKAMLELMEPLPWPARGKSFGDQQRTRDCADHPQIQAARVRAGETIKARYRRQVGNLFGTKTELAKLAGISLGALYRREKAGMTLEQALGLKGEVAA